MEYYPVFKKKEILSHIITGMSREDIILSKISHHKRTNTMIPLTLSIMSYSNSQIYKAEWWSPGAGGMRYKGLFNGYRVSVLQDEKAVEICFATASIYLMPQDHTLKNG